MQCKKCGQEVQDGAIFCGGCGARVDGKAPCKKCGALNDENSAYCLTCGARVDGKTVCAQCGNAYKGNFCPSCGATKWGKAVKTEVPTDAPAKKKEEITMTKGQAVFKKACEIVSGAALMLGVLMSLIFVFMIGVESSSELETGKTIFYFFGEHFENSSDNSLWGSLLQTWSSETASTLYDLYGILGAAIFSAVIVLVIVFSIIATVKYIVSMAKGEENAAKTPALVSIITFLIGAALFYAYTRTTVVYEEEMMGYQMNGSTVAAIVVCIIALVLGIGFDLAGQGVRPWKGEHLGKMICGSLALILAIVVMVLAENFAIVMEEEGASASMNYQLFGISIIQGQFAGVTDSNVELVGSLSLMNVCLVFSQLFAVAILILAAVAIGIQMYGMQGEEKSGVSVAVLLIVFSVLLLLFTILAQSGYIAAVELAAGGYGEIPEFNITGNIVVIILAIMLTVATGIRQNFANKALAAEWVKSHNKL